MQITTNAEIIVPTGVERSFALATDSPRFPRYFKGRGPIPAVLKVEWHAGHRPEAGARRNIHNADGSVLVEEVLELTPPQCHRYRLLSGFKPPFSWMVAHADGSWQFTETGGHTHMRWDYAFVLRSPLAWPVVLPIVKVFFRGAMQDCLRAMRDDLAAGEVSESGR